MTMNGGEGRTGQENLPSGPVRVDPDTPRIVTLAPATGRFEPASTTMPVRGGPCARGALANTRNNKTPAITASL
jgi:hypothetical protein